MGKSLGTLNEPLPPMPTVAISPGPGSAEEWGMGEGVVDRAEVLARYRRLRKISREHGNEVLGRIPRKTFLDWGKRLGLVWRKAFIADGIEEMSLAIDLAVYSARPGKTPPIERYRRTAGFAAGGDEAIMLDAMSRSRFSLFVVKRRHAAAGLVLEDLFQRRDIWLMDEGLEKSAPQGMTMASRVVAPDAFHMTTGAAVSIGPEALEEAAFDFPFADGDASLEEGINVKFIEAVYRAAVTFGLMEIMKLE